MNGLDKIREETVRLEDRVELAKLLETSTAFGEQRPIGELLGEFPYSYVVYVDAQPLRLITCSVSKEPCSGVRTTMRELIEMRSPKSFHDCLYIATCFDPIEAHSLLAKRSPFSPYPGQKDATIDSLLNESYGNLAYHHQVEGIYRMLTGCSPGKAQLFRKGLCKKEPWAWAERQILRFPSGKTLEEVMEERMFGGFTSSPNYHGAMNLYECFLPN